MVAMVAAWALLLPALVASSKVEPTACTHTAPALEAEELGLIQLSDPTVDAELLGLIRSINGQGEDGACPNKGPAEWQSYCGAEKSSMKQSAPINFRHLSKQGICSQFNQDRYLVAIFEAIGTTNSYFVEFGARRPERLNSAHFRLNCGWQGLLLDGAPGATPNEPCPQCAGQDLLEAPEDAPVRLRQAFLTAENMNEHFAKHKVPCEFDLLTVDVDRNDYWLVKAIDFNRFMPRVVVIEFSAYFNAGEKRVIAYQPDGVWTPPAVTGASLAALDDLMKAKGYTLVAQVRGEHAIWVLSQEMSKEDSGMEVPWEVQRGWQWKARARGKKASGFEEVKPPCEGAGCALSHLSCH